MIHGSHDMGVMVYKYTSPSDSALRFERLSIIIPWINYNLMRLYPITPLSVGGPHQQSNYLMCRFPITALYTTYRSVVKSYLTVDWMEHESVLDRDLSDSQFYTKVVYTVIMHLSMQ